MLITVLLLLAGLALLTFGSDFFVQGSSQLAVRLKIKPIIIGLTVVAFGTSAPELFVSLQSTLQGNNGIAIGNVVGSNIANIGLILGICAIITPLMVERQIIRLDMPFLLGVTLLCALFLYGGNFSRIEAILIIIAFAGYLFYTIRTAVMNPHVADPEVVVNAGKSLPLIFVSIVGGLVALLFGSKLLIGSAVKIAEFFNISEKIIGISIVAVGTSLPELASSVVAALRKESDIAIGNIVGSNIFNIGLVLGITGTIKPILVPDLGIIDIAVMLGFAALLMPFLRTGFRLSRWEGVVLLVGYAGYMYALFR